MDAVRAAILRGRRQLSASRPLEALETWRSALSDAFAAEDFAGMFVLTKNLGEASLSLAKQHSRVERAAMLREAISYLQYALSLVDQCDLREELGSFGVLYASVARVEVLLAKAERKLVKAEAVREASAVIIDEREVTYEATEAPELPCTTCEQVVNISELVLDETDGCYYCITCYNEYYASIEGVVEAEIDEMNVPCGSIEGSSPSDSEVTADDPTPTILHTEKEENATTTEEETSEGKFIPTTSEPGADNEASVAEEISPSRTETADELSVAEAVTHAIEDQEAPLDSEVEKEVKPIQYSIQTLLELQGSVPADACHPGLEQLPIFKNSPTFRNRISSSERAPQRGRKDLKQAQSTKRRNEDSHDASSILPSLAEIEAVRASIAGADLSVLNLASELFAMDSDAIQP